MKALKVIFIYGLFFNFQTSDAQNFEPDLLIPVTVNGVVLNNAWAGGFNNPQFSAIDLNGDGIKDLFVFEPTLDRITTYINSGTANQVDYHYDPQYISDFPKMHNWALLTDYNCDSKEDIFTYSYFGGATLYENVSTPGNLQFILQDTLIYSNYAGIHANLYLGGNDLPAFTDVDGDGDLDILTISVGNGGLEFHKNLSMDSTGTCDTLIFKLQTSGWGGLPIGGGTQESDNYLAFDPDSDGDIDLLTDDPATGFGDYTNLFYYENTGNSLNATLVMMDDSFPSYNVPAYIRYFPAAFYLDVNNDGKKDLLVSPQQTNVSENVHNAYFYQDTSSTTVCGFNMVADDFLVGEMIDVGSGANVRFFDVDNDGLKDIISGNFVKREKNGNDSTSLWYFRNTGTTSNPAFQLISNNFANSMTDSDFGMAPGFGDMDGDGDADMLVGLSDGTLSLYTNTAGNFVFNTSSYQAIDIGNACTPYLFDVDQDGLVDLVCGNRNGKLSYFENTGTAASPVFTLISSFWGQVNVVDTLNSIYGYSYPFLYLNNGTLELMVGSLRGYIFRCGNITGNLNGAFSVLDTIYGGIYEPGNVTIDGTDINGDGLMDLLTGNYAGGLTLYKMLPLSINEPAKGMNNFEIYPNPVGNTLTVKLQERSSIRILNLLGEVLVQKIVASGISYLDVSFLSPGIYFIRTDHTALKFIKE